MEAVEVPKTFKERIEAILVAGYTRSEYGDEPSDALFADLRDAWEVRKRARAELDEEEYDSDGAYTARSIILRRILGRE